MTIYQPVRDEMIRLLSVPRLSTYRSASGGDLKAAVELYQWNLEISASLFAAIHYLEVALRNTVDPALTTAYGGATSWFDDPGVPLSAGARQQVQRAKANAAKVGHVVTHGHVVAELPFGFWGSLFAQGYSRTLWRESLRHAFPQARQGRLHSDLESIRRVRNRIAHHEPLISYDLAGEYRRVVATAEQIDMRLAWWIDATSTVARVLERRPV